MTTSFDVPGEFTGYIDMSRNNLGHTGLGSRLLPCRTCRHLSTCNVARTPTNQGSAVIGLCDRALGWKARGRDLSVFTKKWPSASLTHFSFPRVIPTQNRMRMARSLRGSTCAAVAKAVQKRFIQLLTWVLTFFQNHPRFRVFQAF